MWWETKVSSSGSNYGDVGQCRHLAPPYLYLHYCVIQRLVVWRVNTKYWRCFRMFLHHDPDSVTGKNGLSLSSSFSSPQQRQQRRILWKHEINKLSDWKIIREDFEETKWKATTKYKQWTTTCNDQLNFEMKMIIHPPQCTPTTPAHHSGYKWCLAGSGYCRPHAYLMWTLWIF